jgi:hypothetical protein
LEGHNRPLTQKRFEQIKIVLSLFVSESFPTLGEVPAERKNGDNPNGSIGVGDIFEKQVILRTEIHPLKQQIDI